MAILVVETIHNSLYFFPLASIEEISVYKDMIIVYTISGNATSFKPNEVKDIQVITERMLLALLKSWKGGKLWKNKNSINQ